MAVKLASTWTDGRVSSLILLVGVVVVGGETSVSSGTVYFKVVALLKRSSLIKYC